MTKFSGACHILCTKQVTDWPHSPWPSPGLAFREKGNETENGAIDLSDFFFNLASSNGHKNWRLGFKLESPSVLSKTRQSA